MDTKRQLKRHVRVLAQLFSKKPTTRVSATLAMRHIPKLGTMRFLRLWISRKLRRDFCVYVSPRCTYGTQLRLKHPVGIVIGSGVTIGNNVTIFQNVTLGGRRMGDGGTERYPTIGDGTVLFAGAVIIGDVRVGKNCVVGANAVVLSDVPDGATAVGVPAKVVKAKAAVT